MCNMQLTDLEIDYLLSLVLENDQELAKDKRYNAYTTHHSIIKKLKELRDQLAKDEIDGYYGDEQF